MKVLMFGWEFPPFKSGGLGTACYDLTKGMAKKGLKVTFVMPHAPEDANADFVNLLGCNNLKDKVKVRKIDSILTPYMTSESYLCSFKNAPSINKTGDAVYGKNLYEEVYRYSEAARFIAEDDEHDIIHAHDWMTYRAGINAREISGKPLVVHIHATEHDRSGGNPNLDIAHIEYIGLKEADHIIANSNYTKKNVMEHYMIPDEKISVVHWGLDQEKPEFLKRFNSYMKKDGEKIVLSLGRVTVQKGVDKLVTAAEKVLKHEDNVKFMIVGDGHMLPQIIDQTIEAGISDKFIFTGWLKGEEVHKAFQMADLFVMPSLSEPFGLVAIEAMRNGTPVLLSKTSGASEVITNAFKTDFWDTDRMANQIIGLLRYRELEEELNTNSFNESLKFNLEEPAEKCIDIYRKTLGICQ